MLPIGARESSERDSSEVATDPMGQVIGATNRRGEYPVERPLTPRDLLATIDRHLGIDHRAEFRDLSGRPIRILPEGDPIRELI